MTYMKLNKIMACAIVIFCFFSSSCSKDLPPGNYDASEVGKVKKVVPGVIISMRPVNIQGTAEAAATPTVTAAPVDANVTRTRGFEYVIKLSTGSIISVVQNEDLHLKTKQHILIIYGENTRIVANEGGDDI